MYKKTYLMFSVFHNLSCSLWSDFSRSSISGRLSNRTDVEYIFSPTLGLSVSFFRRAAIHAHQLDMKTVKTLTVLNRQEQRVHENGRKKYEQELRNKFFLCCSDNGKSRLQVQKNLTHTQRHFDVTTICYEYGRTMTLENYSDYS